MSDGLHAFGIGKRSHGVLTIPPMILSGAGWTIAPSQRMSPAEHQDRAYALVASTDEVLVQI